MEQRATIDKALQYIRRKLYRDASGNEVLSRHYAELSAKIAFDGGRQSIIDDASKLEWENVGIYGRYGLYLDVCRAHKPLMDYLIREWYQPKDIELFAFGDSVKNGFKSVEEAKVCADEIYKKEIKKVLGL